VPHPLRRAYGVKLDSRADAKGFLKAGAAGATLDPSSSHGVLTALISGSVAAHPAVALCRRGLAMREAAATYQQWLREGFERDVSRLAELDPAGGRSLVRLTRVRYRPVLRRGGQRS